MIWKVDQEQAVLEKFKAIRCLDCDKDLPSRSHLRNHMNHNVVYVGLDGRIA